MFAKAVIPQASWSLFMELDTQKSYTQFNLNRDLFVFGPIVQW